MRLKLITGFLLALALNENGRLMAQTQQQQKMQSYINIEAVPDRPRFSNTADTISKGVFEIEYGIDLAHGYQDINGLVKFGLFKDLEIRIPSYATSVPPASGTADGLVIIQSCLTPALPASEIAARESSTVS